MSAGVTAKIYSGTGRNIALLSRALSRGELVAVPTETVYGLAGDALNVRAVRSIFRAKGRPSNDPLIVHIHSLEQLDTLAERSAAVDRLAHAFWPGPLTLVLPKKRVVPDLVTSGLPSVAVRMPNHPLLRKLLTSCGLPLAAPSANPFGYVSPTTAGHVLDGLGSKIRFILDGGAATIGVESTILDLRDPSRPVILRPGAIERRDIERVLRVRVVAHSPEPAKRRTAAVAPGLLARHYSPRTPVRLHDRLRVTEREAAAHGKSAYLFVRKPSRLLQKGAATNLFWLSEAGDLTEAAHSLFSRLRELDRGAWTEIHAERMPGKNALALAINDRLTRAAAKR